MNPKKQTDHEAGVFHFENLKLLLPRESLRPGESDHSNSGEEDDCPDSPDDPSSESDG